MARKKREPGESTVPPAPQYSLTIPIAPTLRAVFEGLDARDLNALLGPPDTAEPASGSLPLPRLLSLRGGSWLPASLSGILPTSLGVASAHSAILDLEPGVALEAEMAAERVVQSASEPLPNLAQLSTRLSAAPSSDLTLLRPMLAPAMADMDPRLQLAVLNRRSGKPGVSVASAEDGELPVIARVSSFDEWAGMADVHPGADLGVTADGSRVVTGRVPVDRIEAVRASPVVMSLKASQPVQPALAKTTETMQVRSDLLPAGISPAGGSGVVIGIVDTGGDFAHLNFRRSDGSTRLLGLWNQRGVATPSSPFGYGRFYAATEINAALATPHPYATLGYGPRPDGPQQQGAHGTHVMDIAAGNGLGSTVPGVAPQADLVFVEIAATDVAWDGPESTKQSFGDSAQMLEAIRFVFDLAGDRPCVVNLSLGTNGGPHDGTSLVEQGIDALVNAKPNRAVVIAASNSQLDGIHTAGEVPADQALDIGWSLTEGAGGEFELWYDGDERLEVTLIGPDNTPIGTVVPGTSLPVASGAAPVIFIGNRLDDPNNHDNVIGIWLAQNLPGGTWTIRLRSLGQNAVPFHAWIERLDQAQSSFVTPVSSHTLGSISTGLHSIVVGSYDAHKPGFPLSSFSSSGPTRDGRQKPEISAPGGNVVAARSRTTTGVVRKSGTSMAAPAVTGLVALILAEAQRNGTTLTSAQLHAKLLGGTDGTPLGATAGTWDPRYGMGRASGSAI